MKCRKQNRLLMLAALGFALQAIVPAGYMPAPIASGLPFVLCPGGLSGAAFFIANDAGAQHGAHHSHGGEQHDLEAEREPVAGWEFCAFGAALGGPALIAQHDAAFPLFEPDPLPTAVDRIVRSAVTWPWRARAPPTDQPIDV